MVGSRTDDLISQNDTERDSPPPLEFRNPQDRVELMELRQVHPGATEGTLQNDHTEAENKECCQEFRIFFAVIGIFVAFNMQLMIPHEATNGITSNGTAGGFPSKSAYIGDIPLTVMSVFLMLASGTITSLPGYVSPRILLIVCAVLVAFFCGGQLFSTGIASLLTAAAGGIAISLLPAGCNLQMIYESELKNMDDTLSARLPQGLAWLCGSAVVFLVACTSQHIEEYTWITETVLFGIFATFCIVSIVIFGFLPSSSNETDARPNVTEQAGILWRRSRELEILYLTPSFIHFGLHFAMAASVFPKTIISLRGSSGDVIMMIAYFAGAYGAGQGAIQGFLTTKPTGHCGLILTTFLQLSGYSLIAISHRSWVRMDDTVPGITQVATFTSLAASFIFGMGDVMLNHNREFICKKILETPRERNHNVFALAKIYQGLGMAVIFAFSVYLSLPIWALILAIACVVSNFLYYKAYVILTEIRDDDELLGTRRRDEDTLPSFVYMF